MYPFVRMRIWLATRVTPAHGLGGGMELQALAVARGLVERGHDVTIATTRHPAGQVEGEEDGVRALYLRQGSWRRYTRSWWDASYAALEDDHGREPFDAILSTGAGALGYLGRARADLGVATAVTFQTAPRAELITAWRGARTARGLYRLGRAAWRVPRQVARWRHVAGIVDEWLAVAPSVAREVASDLGLPFGRIRVVPNSVDATLFRAGHGRIAARSELGVSPEAPLVLSASRLEREKGVRTLLDALARVVPHVPSVRLVIAGSGSDAAALRRRAAALGLTGRTRFVGHVQHRKMAPLYAAADVFVLPSLCHEGLPLTVLEAQASGVPVIAADSGAVRDAVAPNAGIVVPRGDSAALAGALVRLLVSADRRAALAAVALGSLAGRDEGSVVTSTERALLAAVHRAR